MNCRNNPVVSVVLDGKLRYPEAEDYFSPDQSFPEYQFGHISKKPNAVYAAVRQCLANAGLDNEHFGKPTWNPLKDHISPGKNVFVLCNFVQHQLGRSVEAFHAKCTHGSVVRALIDYVRIALGGRGSVRFGNAPLQSCEWNKVVEETGAQRVLNFYRQFGNQEVMVNLTDLRQHIIHRHALGTVETCFHGNDTDLCVPVDLGSDSLLDALYQSGGEPKFRVLDYDYRRTQRCHAKGRHVYLISKHVLDCDVLVSVPKLKTHEKVGITCGIKGCVGTVAHKDCLAHHRLGPPREGGDEYPDRLAFLKSLSFLHDAVYTEESGSYRTALHLLNQYGRKIVRRFTRALSGSWSGNDTCWRMALDLARIAEYANKEGRLCAKKQRKHIMLTDGVIGGEGDGPLSPRPVPLGYLSFSDNVAFGDYVNCLAMGYDPKKIPMIHEAFQLETYPLAPGDPSKAAIQVNGETYDVDHFRKGMGRKFLTPREWRTQL